MVVAVKRGLVRTGQVVVDGTSYRIRREREGWLSILDSAGHVSGRIRYLEFRDRFALTNGHGNVDTVFRPGYGSFEFGGRTYVIESMESGQLVVHQDLRSVVRGRVTPEGVRLEFVAGELHPIQKELALGLALRSEDLSRLHAWTGGVGPGVSPRARLRLPDRWDP